MSGEKIWKNKTKKEEDLVLDWIKFREDDFDNEKGHGGKLV